MPFNPLNLYKPEKRKPSGEPKKEVRLTQIEPKLVTLKKEAKKPILLANLDPPDPSGGWKKILLEDDPVYIQSEDLDGNFVFPTGDTTEKDISTLTGGPDLTGTKRRRYGLYLDMTGVYQDTAAWTTLITRVKQKIDGTNYRTIDRKDFEKNDFSPSEEPAVPIDLPLLAKDIQVTLQFDVGLTGSPVTPRIYWAWVKEKLE